MKSLLIPFLSVLAVVSLGVLSPAQAALGPAPASQERQVVSGVHADAISVFADHSGLTLGSKADVDGNLGVRLDPNLTLFNVEEAARTTIPNLPSFSFLGVAGGEVWIAPESNPGGALLWPGFSTEGVPTGVLDGNQLTLRLEAVSGPGTLHVFQSGAFGEPNRLFSSTDTVHRAWTLPRGTHAHANWAFSAPGVYTLTFSVNALRGGSAVTDTQDYRFHVGELPTAVTTTTTLAASTNATILGTAVDLTATVTPAGAVGYVEFVDGTTVLGHEAVSSGSAGLTTTNLLLGARSVTARFVPQWLNDFSASTSAPVAITVTETGGVPFGIAGVAASYLPGATLTAQVVGHTLQPGQKYRWQWRVNGATEFEIGDVSTSPDFTRDLSASDNGYELSVSVWFCEEWDEYCSDGTVVAQSPWVPVTVGNLGDPIVATLLSPTHAHLGDEALIAVSGRTLAEGETLQVVRRDRATGWHTWSSDELFAHQSNTVRIYLLAGGEFAVRVLNAEGVAVAQSAPMPIKVEEYEVQIAGVHGLYRPGATLQAQGIIHPESTNLFYQWSLFVPGGLDLGIIKEGYGAGAATLEIPDLTLAHNAGVLFLSVSVPIGPPFVEEEGVAMAGQINVRVYVRDIDPGQQIFQFQPLPDHYHQGNTINLVLGVDPLPALGDQIVWEWRWPGGDWAALPGATGTSHSLVAEQALDGLQVRSGLVFADTNLATIGAGPVTIFVDDHGAAARQQPIVAGVTSYMAGQQATLTRQLPANGPTILTTHRWERKAAGASEFTVIPEATGATLNFTTVTADHGAQYRVSILKPDGTVAYGPSPAVALDVTPEISSDFSITGVAASYQPGDVLQARIAGVTLAEGQEIQWRIRPVGTDFTGTVLGLFVLPETNNPESRAGRLDLRLDASFDNYELQAAVIKADQTLGTTGWVPVRVADAVQPLSLTYVGPVPFRIGDTATLAAHGRALAPGESLRVALYPGLPHYSLWFVPESGFSTIAPGTFQFEPSGQTLLPMALQVVRDGLVVAQSESLVVDAARVEFFFEGMQPVYRVGQTFSASIRTAPDLGDKVTYSWAMYDTYENPMKVANGEAGRTFEMPVTAEMNGKRMFIQANVIYPGGNVGLVGGAYPFLTVTTNTAQLFLFSSLNEHYHQGDSVNLTLTADPGLTAADSVAWEWRWPGVSWETLPQAAGLSHRLTAEQAMDGLEVRATLNFGHTNLTLLAGPVTIRVDDHGILALQQPKITGLTNVAAGNLVTLTRELPANGPTILTTHRWEQKAAGASEFSVVTGATNSTLTFPATMADDGAQYRVSILKPDGALAYGPSPTVTLDVMTAPRVYTGGHADIGVSYVENQLVFRYVLGASAIVDGSPLGAPAHAAPGEIITQAGAAAYQPIAGPIAAYFPGKTHGYFFGAQSSETSPYLGLGADDPSLSAQSWVTAPGDEPFPRMRYRITGVNYTGPAANPQVLYYDFGSTGDLFINYNHLDPASATPLPLPIVTFAHAHPSWGFSDPGIYDITWTASAEHATNGPMTATGVFRFEILPVPEPLRPIVLDQGHIDLFELTWNTNSGQLDLKVKDDTGLYAPDVAFWQPENVTILVDTALSERMFGDDDLPPGYEFIPRNQPIYILESSQQDGLPWPGWSTERLLDSLPEGVTIPFDTGSVEFGVTVEGPGDVVTFIDGGFGTPSNRFIDTTDEAPDVILTDSSIHYHTAWLFTEPGDYLLTVTPRAYPSFPSKADPLTGPAHVYHIRVGPRPEFETLPDGFAASIAGAPDSVTNDTPVNLQFVLSGPQPAIGGYQWYHGVTGVGSEAIPGATGTTVSLTVDPFDFAQLVIFDPTGRILTSAFVSFQPPPGPPGAPIYVGAWGNSPNAAYVSWSTPYDGRSPLTKQVVTLIPQTGEPVVQEVPGDVNDASFAAVAPGVYTATVQAFNALGAGAVSEPSSPFTVLPSLSITQTGAAPGTFTLVVATQNGVVYQVESAPSLTGPWDELGDPINGTGQTVDVVVPLNSAAGFFRWRLVEAP